jgi:hypothetical protein
MMNPPSVNQITKAYQGNPAPLAQKVDQDKKQNGGIPQDLRQLLALNDINQMRQGAGIQAALNAPANMPTVAEDVQAKAKQALQARMVQEAQKQMAKDGRPGIIPFGVPQPKPQPEERGIDSLASNVGESYAHGGVVAFQEGGTPPDTRSAEDILRESMRVNEEVKRQAAIDRQKAEVGAPDTAQIDRLVAELEGRKSKLVAPKPGYDAMMEYLAQIANAPAGARSSFAAGSYGAQQQNALQKAREEQQNTLTEKMIDLAQKKSDVGYQYKKDLFGTGNAAAEAAIKQKYDAAIQVARTDQDKLKLAQERDLELKKLDMERQKIGAMNKPAVGIQVANMLMAADPDMSKPEALRQGFLISQGGELKTQQLDARKVKEFEDVKAKIEKQWDGKAESMLANSTNPKSVEKYNKWKMDRDAEITRARDNILGAPSGGLPQALLATSGGAPSAPPAGGGYTVMAGGKVYNFPTQAAADAFKQASGAK